MLCVLAKPLSLQAAAASHSLSAGLLIIVGCESPAEADFAYEVAEPAFGDLLYVRLSCGEGLGRLFGAVESSRAEEEDVLKAIRGVLAKK